MSWPRFRTLESFREQNPGWEITLYRGKSGAGAWRTTEQQDAGRYHGEDHLPRVAGLDVEERELDLALPDGCSHVHASDLMAWHVLATEGGVVADMDIAWLRPMETLGIFESNARAGLTCFRRHPKPGYLPVTFMVSAGDVPFFAHVLKRALAAHDPDVYESCGSGCLGSWGEALAGCPGMYRLPDEVVYPFTHLGYSDMIRALHLPAYGQRSMRSVGMHWYAGHPLSQKANLTITAENVHSNPSALAVALRCHA